MRNFWLNRCKHPKNNGTCVCPTSLICNNCGGCNECGGMILPKHSIGLACGSPVWANWPGACGSMISTPICGSLVASPISGPISGQLSGLPLSGVPWSGGYFSPLSGLGIICASGYDPGDKLSGNVSSGSVSSGQIVWYNLASGAIRSGGCKLPDIGGLLSDSISSGEFLDDDEYIIEPSKPSGENYECVYNSR